MARYQLTELLAWFHTHYQIQTTAYIIIVAQQNSTSVTAALGLPITSSSKLLAVC
jgi:hypothetical protein